VIHIRNVDISLTITYVAGQDTTDINKKVFASPKWVEDSNNPIKVPIKPKTISEIIQWSRKMLDTEQIIQKIRLLTAKVSDNPTRHYPLDEGTKLLYELKLLGYQKKEVYALVLPLWNEFENKRINQDFVGDLLDMIWGDYVGKNIIW
jgi:hypothetical protein